MKGIIVTSMLALAGVACAQIPGAATYAELQAQHEAAVAKLPALSRERLEQLVTALEEIKYPISFARLKELVGGESSLVWCSSAGHAFGDSHTGTDTFALTRPSSKGGTYVLVVDYARVPIDSPLTTVVRARVAFDSPLEWRFFAQSTKQLVEIGEQPANKSPEPTSTVVTPPASASDELRRDEAKEPRRP